MNQSAEAEPTDAVPAAVDTSKVEGPVTELTCARSSPCVNESFTSRPELAMLYLSTVMLLPGAAEITDPDDRLLVLLLFVWLL
jgi:hypothetical protein